MRAVDPDARQIREGGEVVVAGQQLGLEAAHLAGRCAATLNGPRIVVQSAAGIHRRMMRNQDESHHRAPENHVDPL